MKIAGSSRVLGILLTLAGIVAPALRAQPLSSESAARTNNPTGRNEHFIVMWSADRQACLQCETGTSRFDTPRATTGDSGFEVGPAGLAADAHPRVGTVSNSNGVLEPGELVVFETSWWGYGYGYHPPTVIHGVSGTLSNFTGPAGGVYTLGDASATYGDIPDMGAKSCDDGSADACYTISVSAAGPRPATHWDATVQEDLSSNLSQFVGGATSWTLHIGESFSDVPVDDLFYNSVETIFHKGVTAGCAAGVYCPGKPVTRAQMAVFLLKSKFGAAHVPPPCTGNVFTDVPCAGGGFDPWIEELAELQVTSGCAAGLFCPDNTVTRQQLAVLLLKTREGAAYAPPACAGLFADVPCTPGVGFSDWIEDLANRGITAGCSAAPALYCPTDANSRGQMSALVTRTFGLVLYGAP